MKKGLIFTILLMSVLALGFSQTGNSWTVSNTSTWIEAVNGIRSGGNNKQYTITVQVLFPYLPVMGVHSAMLPA